jgi:hypothetical protein
LAPQAWTLENTQNASAVRVKQGVFKRSAIGGLATLSTQGAQHQGVGGLDLQLRSTQIIPNKTVELIAAAALGFDGDQGQKGDTWRLALRWPNARWNAHLGWEHISSDYDPPLGFIALQGVNRLRARAHYTHHYKNPKHALRNLQATPLDVYAEFEDDSGAWSHYRVEVVPLEGVTRSGMWAKAALMLRGFQLSEPWEILSDFSAPAGTHHDWGAQAMFANGWHRQINVFMLLEESQYFGASRSRARFWTQWKASPHFRASTSNALYWIRHGGDHTVARTHNLRTTVSLNRRWHSSLFGQWNSESEEALINARVRWIPRPGADVYLVLNQAFDPDWNAAGTSIQAKIAWRYGL